jgi:hypothetical protein
MDIPPEPPAIATFIKEILSSSRKCGERVNRFKYILRAVWEGTLGARGRITPGSASSPWLLEKCGVRGDSSRTAGLILELKKAVIGMPLTANPESLDDFAVKKTKLGETFPTQNSVVNRYRSERIPTDRTCRGQIGGKRTPVARFTRT